MIKELAKIIVDELYIKLDDMYNYKKEKEGLVSCQNTMINNLKKEINKWYEKQVENEKRINKMRIGK